MTACTQLDKYIPPDDTSEGSRVRAMPPLLPRQRVVSNDADCALCQVELENMDDEARVDHVCTHDQSSKRKGHDARSSSGSGGSGRSNVWEKASHRDGVRKQPNPGVIKIYVQSLD